jgi:hypothetical protein
MTKKFLCICQGGTVRSSALAWLLKYNGGQDALAASAEKNSAATLRLLWKWADYVVFMSPEILQYMPPAVLKGKRYAIVDVGADRYGSPFHPELMGQLAPVVAEWQRRDWDINAEPS